MLRRLVCLLGLAAILMLMLTGCSDTAVDVSGDGSQVAVSQNGALWVADVEHENWRKVPLEGVSASSPTWSPDGRYVLFALRSGPQETPSSDNSGNAPVTEQGEQKESTSTALFDTQTQSTITLASGVGPPFAWRPDSGGFVALQHNDENSHLVWFRTDGGTTRTVSLPETITALTRLVLLTQSDDVAFIAVQGEGDNMQQTIFRTEADHIQRLTKEGDLIGLGYAKERERLFWARSWSEGRGIRMALNSYDPTTGAVNRLPFPENLSFVRPEAGFTASVESAVFSWNGERMAIVVQFVRGAEREGEQDLIRRACYSVETNGSGSRLIRQAEPDGGNLYPAWSRDGRRLVILDDSGESPRLFVYNHDGTGKRLAALPTQESEASNTP
jgi:dipeptidyl aminopeptidase/acylaminoacyl peptidase